jgi:hypothetical protein
MLDEYGYGQRDHGCVVKINLTRLCGLWRKLLRHPKQKGWQAMCDEAQRDDVEFKRWFQKSTEKDQP